MSISLDPKVWLVYAEEDLSAEEEDVTGNTVPRIACFNAQQAVEKLIKAVLLQFGISFPKTHDLTALEALLPGNLQARTALLILGSLTDWCTQARYPDKMPIATAADAQAALKTAEDAFAILRSEIK